MSRPFWANMSRWVCRIPVSKYLTWDHGEPGLNPYLYYFTIEEVLVHNTRVRPTEGPPQCLSSYSLPISAIQPIMTFAASNSSSLLLRFIFCLWLRSWLHFLLFQPCLFGRRFFAFALGSVFVSHIITLSHACNVFTCDHGWIGRIKVLRGSKYFEALAPTV